MGNSERVSIGSAKVVPPQSDIDGVKPEVARMIYDSLGRGRTHFGSAGASLSWQAYAEPSEETAFDAGAAKAGLDGEVRTSIMIQEWMRDKPGCVLIDSVHLRKKGEKGSWENSDDVEWGESTLEDEGYEDKPDTDHMLIVGNMVIIIDSKNWKNKKTYSINDSYKVLRSNRGFPGGDIHIAQAQHLWTEYLLSGTQFSAIVHITQEEITIPKLQTWWQAPFKLVGSTEFKEQLDVVYNKLSVFQKNTINSSLVSQVVVCAVKPFSPLDRFKNSTALKNFK